MSGICAVWQRQDPGRTPAILTAMCGGLSLDRGEVASTAAGEFAGLGISARFPTQQLYRGSRVMVACEADLYNQTELRGLIGNFAGGGKTETAELMAGLYDRFGADFVGKLRGDFSMVLWDEARRLMLAATDDYAIHPLVYYQDARILMVASRIEALAASGKATIELHPGAIANYLNYTVNLAPQTIFAGVNRMLPGTVLAATENNTEFRRYWDMSYPVDEKAGEEELSRGLESVVEEAVRIRAKESDFSRMGAFLSGGTDSSTVVGMMDRLQRGPVKTFSIGFDEERFNELEYARITARKFATDHHEYLVNAADCAAALPDMIRYFDEPNGNSSAIPTYFCARLAAQHGVDILLAGDGGDELFGGNERYLTDRIFGAYEKIPEVVRKGLVEPLLGAIPARNGVVRLARSYVRRANLRQPDRFFSYHLLLDNPLNSIFEPEFLAGLGDYSVIERPSFYYWQGPANDHLNRLLYLDLKITLADNDLLKVTRMSELAGIRSRFPFLDRSVSEFSGRIPARLKVKGTQKRYLFKRAFRNLLPLEVIQKKKHGFGIPVAFWMKSDPRMREITNDILLSSRTYQRGVLRRSFVEELLRRYETDTTPFYGDTLWTFLTLELWFRQFMDPVRKVAA
jgi:asparagine synthase (glutamine-hydrolysing)